jgi:tRNA-dihydrouridine synthase
MLSYHGEYQGILRFRKHLKAYLSGYNLSGELLRSLLTTKSSEELIAAVESVFTFMQPERGADLTATALESAY